MAGEGSLSGPGAGAQITPKGKSELSSPLSKGKKEWFNKFVIGGNIKGAQASHISVGQAIKSNSSIGGVTSIDDSSSFDEIYYGDEPFVNDGSSISFSKDLPPLSAVLLRGVSSYFAITFKENNITSNIRFLTNASGNESNFTTNILVYAANFPSQIPRELFNYKGILNLNSVQGVMWSGKIINFELTSSGETVDTSTAQLDSDTTPIDKMGKTVTYNREADNKAKLITTQNNLNAKPNQFYDSNGNSYIGKYYRDLKGNTFAGVSPSAESFPIYLAGTFLSEQSSTSQKSSESQGSSVPTGGY